MAPVLSTSAAFLTALLVSAGGVMGDGSDSETPVGTVIHRDCSIPTNPDGSPTTPTSEATTSRDSWACSMSNEPQRDNVAYAGGIVAVAALVFGLRRRFRKDDDNGPPPPRDPYESTM